MRIESTLLSIAGSDPSGGAGIQADLKTMTAIGVYGAAAITCLTVQNSCGVQDIITLDPAFVQQQIQAVLADHSVSHIKIGMLGSLEIIEMVGSLLVPFTGTVVYDPVLAATTGESLLSGEGLDLIQSELLTKITYLTPNRQEIAYLGGQPVQTIADGIKNAQLLLEKYPNIKGIFVKGGHFHEKETEISDFLIFGDGKQFESKRKRISSANLHGTGCTFATAFCSYLMLEGDASIAFTKAGNFMGQVILAGLNKRISNSETNGPLLHHLAS